MRISNLVFTTMTMYFVISSIDFTFGQVPFDNCAAIFINDKMVVDEYSDRGQCNIDSDATGILTVQTADLSVERGLPILKIHFKIAIRDGNTKTLLSYSDQTFIEESLEKILAKCKPGDSVVILTIKDEYSLPHNEILIH